MHSTVPLTAVAPPPFDLGVSITDAGLTDHQLARLLDVSPSYIYKIKTGRSEPSLRLRRRLFQVFGRDDLIAVLDSMTGRRP